ncbi:hypothetical protein NL676_025076 [Syzygium grande]|nr:hypothetical protein NL676_025076 [Syzygium grande]
MPHIRYSDVRFVKEDDERIKARRIDPKLMGRKQYSHDRPCSGSRIDSSSDIPKARSPPRASDRIARRTAERPASRDTTRGSDFPRAKNDPGNYGPGRIRAPRNAILAGKKKEGSLGFEKRGGEKVLVVVVGRSYA